MTEDQLRPIDRTPWHIWLVGVLALLWNSVGAFDYLMTETQNESYMGQFTPEQLEYFYSFPTWFVAVWAVAVWGGVLGAVLLLLRKRLAEPVFLASFVAMVINSIYTYALSDGLELMGTTGAVFSVVIFIVSLGLWLYARAMVRRGLLA